MAVKTLFRWEQNPSGGGHGTMVLWPNTSRELRLTMTDFRDANRLGLGINSMVKGAFEDGRRSMLKEIAELHAKLSV